MSAKLQESTNLLQRNNIAVNYKKNLQNRKFLKTELAFLCWGGNISGHRGTPLAAIVRGMAMLDRHGLPLLNASKVYLTWPAGPRRQPRYHNCVTVHRSTMAPAALLRLLKQLERDAGRRRPGTKWGPRALDVDIIDHGGRILNWPSRDPRRGRLVLPHPEALRRAFVLRPLLDVAPHWRHPVTGQSAAAALARIRRRRPADDDAVEVLAADELLCEVRRTEAAWGP